MDTWRDHGGGGGGGGGGGWGVLAGNAFNRKIKSAALEKKITLDWNPGPRIPSFYLLQSATFRFRRLLRQSLLYQLMFGARRGEESVPWRQFFDSFKLIDEYAAIVGCAELKEPPRNQR